MTEVNVAGLLQDELAVALQEAKGLTFAEASDVVAPLVRYLQQQYGGDRIYIPMPYAVCDIATILAERADGVSMAEILRRHNISRRTYFRLLSRA